AVDGRPIDLGPRTTGYRHWAGRLAEFVRDGGFDADLAYWTADTDSTTLPVDRAGANTAGTARTVSVRLNRHDTEALLRKVPDVYRTQINDVLLAALGRVLAQWTGSDRVLVGLEGHGRTEIIDGIDLSRTIGWFTAEYPVALTLP